jgi:rod shape determining protein RodA
MIHRGISDTAIIVFAALLLTCIGLVALYSFDVVSSGEGVSYFRRQLVFVGIAFFVGLFLSRFSYRAFRTAGTPLYFFAVALLLFTAFLGETVRGTAGWIDLGFARVQPVEVVKILLILFLANFFSSKRMAFGDVGRIVVSFGLVVVLVGLVLMQPDLGSAIILLSIWTGMLFVSDMKMRYVFLLFTAGVLVAAGSWFFLEDYQKDRILATIHPEADAQGSGYNVIQSVIAVGSGGLLGKGVGGGSQSQLLFLPERHTDFIFASIAESLGFVGVVCILSLYGLLLFRIASVAVSAEDNFGFLAASGVYVMLLAHIGINIGMNMGIVPVTGIPLPLLSYGGSSLIATAAGLGIVIGIASSCRFFVRTDVDERRDEFA